MNVFLVSKIYPETFEQQANGTLSKAQIQDVLLSGCSTILQIGKCREKGTAIGKIIKLWFEKESNRLKTDPYENIVFGWADAPMRLEVPLETLQYETTDPFASNNDANETPF